MPLEGKHVELPLRAAGGGDSAEKAERVHVPRFEAGHATDKHLSKIYEQHVKDKTFQEGRNFSDAESFFEYMRSRSASALAPPSNNDLNQPLSSYYISSSHNTYLVGHQLYGDATTAGYTNVLKRGCRCLEIDIWDGDDSDTSASDSDEDAGPKTSSSPKKSKWGRMKAKAKVIRGSSPRREHHVPDQGNNGQIPAAGDSLSVGNAEGQATFKPEPQVVHGYTLTAAIPFRDVCAAIKESAFAATDLPLIVSLETHASLEQQETMVEIIKEHWGPYLVDTNAIDAKGFESLPSPESLRGKILVKVKQAGTNKLEPGAVKSNTTDGSTQSQEVQTKPSKMLPSLSELGLFTRAFSFKHWDQPEAKLPTHVFSLTDSKAHGMLSDPVNGVAMFKHNLSFLTRVYPKGTRISSSNYDPAFHWRHGAQMVALNWQKLDTGMMLNEAMFAGCDGWVLKPDGFRANSQRELDVLKSSADIANFIPNRTMTLKLQVFSGESLPMPAEKDGSHASKIKPYIKFELHVDTHGPPGQGKNGDTSQPGADSDDEDPKQRRKHKRRSKTQRSDSPDFEGECFIWSNVDVVEQLSFLRYVLPQFPLCAQKLANISDLEDYQVHKRNAVSMEPGLIGNLDVQGGKFRCCSAHCTQSVLAVTKAVSL